MKKLLSIALACGLSFLIINISNINNKAEAQTATTNIYEIDPAIPVRLGWDYVLPDPNIKGFKIYKRIALSNSQFWSLIGQKSITSASTALDLFYNIPAPYEGVYSVSAFNDEFESEYSQTVTLINKPASSVPMPPTNLRVIQIK